MLRLYHIMSPKYEILIYSQIQNTTIVVCCDTNISVRYESYRTEATAETLNKQNPRKRVICISSIVQDCNTWVWSKELARDGAGYLEDLYHHIVCHRLPVTIRIRIHNQLVDRPLIPSTMPSNKDLQGCLDLTPVNM